jgi:hypothetical protein
MDDRRTLDQLKEIGAGRPAPEDVVFLYRQAFAEFGTAALWSTIQLPQPTLAAALSITESLRVEGDRSARRLAERIEEACRAAL